MSPTQAKRFTVLSPTAILGYGFPIASFERGMAANPDLIAVDAGSTDPGPYYLGSGKSFTNRAFVKRDLTHMIKAGLERGIPVVVGTAGGSGAASHLAWTREIVEEIALELEVEFTLGIVSADISPEVVTRAFEENRIRPLAGVHELTPDHIHSSTNIVAQMGTEPIAQLLEQGCQVVVAGRAYDPAVFAALPIMRGFDPGLALHMGKILECAAIAATPGSGADCALGILEEDGFTLAPLSDKRRFTCESTAAHTLYEKSDPYHLPGPGGELDLTGCTFTQLDEHRVKVSGTRFIPTERYAVKLEGAAVSGYRTISIAGLRDPIMIASIDTILEEVRAQVHSMMDADSLAGEIYFHLYGKDGVMGPLEPERHATPHELGLVIEALCPTEAEAETLCSITRSTLLHYGYEGRISTAGNLAFPFSPSDTSMGAVYTFSIYHLMELRDEAELRTLFPTQIIRAGRSAT